MTEKTDKDTTAGASKAISRRNFIKGVIAGGAAVSSAGYLFRGSSLLESQQSTAAVGERLITLNINGQQRRVDVMKQETLAWTLRYKLGLTGTKLGCDRAECGVLHRADRRCAALLMFGAYPYGARPESCDHRRPGKPRRNTASGAAGRHRRTGFPVRVLSCPASSWLQWDS